MEPAKLDDTVIALLFAADEPISARRIAGVVEDTDTAMVKESLDRLMTRFARELPSIVLEHVAGGFQLSTNAAYSEFLARLYSGRRKQRLSKAGMETLAIIAYRQPITRADIESVRGVGCGGVVTTLMERSLIKIVGKAKVLGAPFLYGTTLEFLEYLGLNTLTDLPSIEELEALLAKEEASHSAPEPSGPGSADEAPGNEWTDETEDVPGASLSTGDSGEAAPAATVEPWTTEPARSETPPESSDNESQEIPVDERDA